MPLPVPNNPVDYFVAIYSQVLEMSNVVIENVGYLQPYGFTEAHIPTINALMNLVISDYLPNEQLNAEDVIVIMLVNRFIESQKLFPLISSVNLEAKDSTELNDVERIEYLQTNLMEYDDISENDAKLIAGNMIQFFKWIFINARIVVTNNNRLYSIVEFIVKQNPMLVRKILKKNDLLREPVKINP